MVCYIGLSAWFLYIGLSAWCCAGGAWVNSVSYGDDIHGVTCTHGNCSSDTVGGMSRICWTSWGVYEKKVSLIANTHRILNLVKKKMYWSTATKTVCMLVRPQQSQGRYSTRVRLGNQELGFIQEFRYLKDISWLQTVDMLRILEKNSWGKMLLGRCWSGSSHLHLLRQISYCSSHIVTLFMDVLFGVIHSRTLLENLLRVLVTHSCVLLTSPDTPSRVWHLRWTQLTIWMWRYMNLLTAWWAE